jgi:TP901 family phage tail tape measure protein
MAIELGDGVIRVTGDFGSFDAQMANVSRTAGFAAAAIGGAIAAGLVTATKAAIDFESAFAGVRKTVDATEDEFAVLSAEIRNLAREIPLSANELAKIAEIAGQLGIQKDAIAEFTEVIAKLGFASDLTGEEAATMLAQFINITGLDPGSIGNLSATIVDLGNNSATSEKKILELGLRISAAGTIAGLADAEILGIAAAFASVGTKAEAGGTVISRVLLGMNDAVIVAGEGIAGLTKSYDLNKEELLALAAQVQEVAASGGSLAALVESTGLTKTQLEQLAESVNDSGQRMALFAETAGKSAQEFAEAWREDPAVAFEQFVLGLERVQAEGRSMGTLLDDLGLKGVRIADIMGRGALASDKLSGSIQRGLKSFSEAIALNVEFEKRLQTLASQIQLLINDLTELAIVIGEKITPVLKELIPLVRDFVGWVIDFTKEHPLFVGGILASSAALAAFLLALAPVLIALPGLMTLFGGTATAAAGAATAGAGVSAAYATAATVLEGAVPAAAAAATTSIAVLATTVATAVAAVVSWGLAIVAIRKKLVAQSEAEMDVAKATNNRVIAINKLIETLESEGVVIDRLALNGKTLDEQEAILIARAGDLEEATKDQNVAIDELSRAMLEANGLMGQAVPIYDETGIAALNLRDKYQIMTGEVLNSANEVVDVTESSLNQILTAQQKALLATIRNMDDVHDANMLWSPGTEGSPSAVQLTADALQQILELNTQAANGLFGILDAIHSAFVSTWESIANFVGNTLSNISSAAGSVLGAFGGAIPGFAAGTDFAPGGIARVHKDETIFLPRGSAVSTAAASQRAFENGGGGGITITGPLIGNANISNDMDLSNVTNQIVGALGAALGSNLAQRGLSTAVVMP